MLIVASLTETEKAELNEELALIEAFHADYEREGFLDSLAKEPSKPATVFAD
jgi:hypothetical protein